jgi:hypothetical protein
MTNAGRLHGSRLCGWGRFTTVHKPPLLIAQGTTGDETRVPTGPAIPIAAIRPVTRNRLRISYAGHLPAHIATAGHTRAFRLSRYQSTSKTNRRVWAAVRLRGASSAGRARRHPPLTEGCLRVASHRVAGARMLPARRPAPSQILSLRITQPFRTERAVGPVGPSHP